MFSIFLTLPVHHRILTYIIITSPFPSLPSFLSLQMGSDCSKQKANDRRKLQALKKTADPELRAILDTLSLSTTELFGKLNAFLTNKMGIEALRAELVPPGVLEAVEVKAVGLYKDDGHTRIKIELYQRQIDGTSPITSVEEVYAVAEKVLPLFEKMLNEIATAAGADVTVKLPPLKAKGRALPKARDDYGEYECPNGGPAVGWVFDIVRGTLSCGSVESIKMVVALLVQDTRITITIKFKNRFKNPTPNGFCDMLLQVVFAENGLVHTCEIQVHLRPITEYAVEHKSHESYDYFRVLFQGSMNTVAARLKDMAIIVGPHFAPAEDGVAAAAVLEDIVVDVLESKDGGRLGQLVKLMTKYLLELDLAIYVGRAFLAVQIEEKGAEHGDVGAVYNNMANVLVRQGKNEEAVAMYQQALEIWVKALGPDHEKVGNAYNGIATVLNEQGKHDDAIAMYQKALDIRVKALDPDHEDVGATYNNIANVLDAQGKHEEALAMHHKSLDIKVKALGPDHEDVGAAYNNIAIVLRKQGKNEEAMQMYQKALDIAVKALGPDHESVGSAYNGIGQVLDEQGKYEEAMTMYQKSLDIQVKALGPDHLGVGLSYFNMGLALEKQQKWTKALEYHERCLKIFQNSLGAEHPHTKRAIANVNRARGKVA